MADPIQLEGYNNIKKGFGLYQELMISLIMMYVWGDSKNIPESLHDCP